MNKLTKENKGITLVILVLTIIILLIITGTITGSAIKAYKDAQVTEFVMKMQILQAKVDEKNLTDEQINNLPNASNDNLIILQEAKANNEISTDQNFKYLSKENVERLFELENIDDMDDEFLINFTTREVVSVTGVEYEKSMYYTQYLLPGAQTLKNKTSGINRILEFNVNSEKEKIIINNIQIANATLSYKKENEDFWTDITNYTEIRKRIRSKYNK